VRFRACTLAARRSGADGRQAGRVRGTKGQPLIDSSASPGFATHIKDSWPAGPSDAERIRPIQSQLVHSNRASQSRRIAGDPAVAAHFGENRATRLSNLLAMRGVPRARRPISSAPPRRDGCPESWRTLDDGGSRRARRIKSLDRCQNARARRGQLAGARVGPQVKRSMGTVMRWRLRPRRSTSRS